MRARRRTALGSRRSGALLALTVLAAGVLSGCTGGDAAAPSPTPTSERPAPPTPSSTPSPTPEPEPTEAEAPAPLVELTGDRVGDLVIGEPVELAQVEELLGPADEVAAFLADCGAPHLDHAMFAGLAILIDTDDGSLFGWTQQGEEPAAGVAYPHDLGPGAAYADVAALPGAQTGYVENFQVESVEADGVVWWFETTDPASPAVVLGSVILGCG
ncbi:hypothetical protein [Actinotalea solisilvae]|uniref:hypothetical protein n=1 Tax=Actinotalea solisilvae TaxID=2072922 RepID=UPI0018F1CD2E|nr:hypothetical protein [Actinotalea solisilvae]